MILAFLPPNIEVHLCCRCSHSSTSRSVSSLRRFDVYNHSQPWTPHERQQPLAIIGCCRSEPGRGWGWGSLKYRKRKRGRSGEEWRWNNKGDEALLVVIPISRSRLIVRPVCRLFLFQHPPFVHSPTFPYSLSLPAIYLNCTHCAWNHWQDWDRNWFGGFRMPCAQWRAGEECVSFKKCHRVN